MPPKEETTQTTIDGETITQVAELSAVPEVDAVDGTMAAAAQQLNDAIVAFGKALADSLRPVVDAIVDTFRNIVDVIRNAWPEYEDEIIHSVATPRQVYPKKARSTEQKATALAAKYVSANFTASRGTSLLSIRTQPSEKSTPKQSRQLAKMTTSGTARVIETH